MLKSILTISFALLLPLCFLTAQECAKSVKIEQKDGVAKLSSDQKTWTSLNAGQQVAENYFLKTEAKSSVTLLFPDGSSLKVGENSMINTKEILSSQSCERENYKVKVFFGKVWSNVKKMIAKKDGENFTVESKNAVAGVRGTSFGFVVNPDESGAVMVLTGAVEVKGEKQKSEGEKNKPMDIQEWKKNRSKTEVGAPAEVSKKEWDSFVVEAMQMIKFTSDGKLQKPIPIGKHNADTWYIENSK